MLDPPSRDVGRARDVIARGDARERCARRRARANDVDDDERVGVRVDDVRARASTDTVESSRERAP